MTVGAQNDLIDSYNKMANAYTRTWAKVKFCMDSLIMWYKNRILLDKVWNFILSIRSQKSNGNHLCVIFYFSKQCLINVMEGFPSCFRMKVHWKFLSDDCHQPGLNSSIWSVFIPINKMLEIMLSQIFCSRLY